MTLILKIDRIKYVWWTSEIARGERAIANRVIVSGLVAAPGVCRPAPTDLRTATEQLTSVHAEHEGGKAKRQPKNKNFTHERT